ncbi:hypothetical protein HAX54_049982 [Datura stramonium]|uniref:Uncharacterized protein n=1 Tax=Datura stramonium TaxID=4076 RepID=A0ABS8SWK3_DATST|nr:hypothetical protein [Datura stramonium]
MTPKMSGLFRERSGEYRGWLVLRVWVPDDKEEERGGWKMKRREEKRWLGGKCDAHCVLIGSYGGFSTSCRSLWSSPGSGGFGWSGRWLCSEVRRRLKSLAGTMAARVFRWVKGRNGV